MKLYVKSKLDNDWLECKCELTDKLDELAGLSGNFFSHYILVTPIDIKEKCLAIRVPGGTVGSLRFDEERCITKIGIDKNYVVRTYPNNLDEELQKFIGTAICEQEGTSLC